MPIVAQSEKFFSKKEWGQLLAESLRSRTELLAALNLQEADFPGGLSVAQDFPVLVPRPFMQRMRKGDPHDPLLLQVLPLSAEEQLQPGFSTDPLGEQDTNVTAGVIHKYHGRVLLLAASGCAVNCRYCFRRHFPYDENRLSRAQWQSALIILRDSSISSHPSGGDPLMQDAHSELVVLLLILSCPATRHSRLPVVIMAFN